MKISVIRLGPLLAEICNLQPFKPLKGDKAIRSASNSGPIPGCTLFERWSESCQMCATYTAGECGRFAVYVRKFELLSKAGVAKRLTWPGTG